MDIEMYGQRKPLHLPTGRFACMSVYLGGDEVYQVYDLHGMREALNRMRPGLWCLQNSLYDLRHLRRFAPVPEVPVWDTLLVSLHLSAGLYKLHGLPELSRRELGVKMEKVVRNEFEKATEMTPEMKQYAAEDAWATRHIALRQMDIRAKGIVSFTPYEEITSKAIWAVLDMRKVRFNKDAFIGLAKTFGDQGRALQAQLGINVNSTREAKAFAGSILGRELDSSAASILDPIIGSYEDPDELSGPKRALYDLLQARTLLKMESTYGESFLADIEPGGYVMPGWKLDGPVTGRMACSSPNLMNVPQREIPEYRDTVIASPGHRYVVSDASQQEPRVGAVLTQDPNLMALVRTGESIYIMVARELLHEEITKKHPRYAPVKAGVLGTFYGLGHRTLAKREGIPVSDAKDIQDGIFNRYPKVSVWMQKAREKAFSRGYAETVLGRRMHINPHGEESWQNQAVNYPVQGTAAEITKLAFVLMHDGFKSAGMEFPITLQVHDELNADVPEDKVNLAKEIMTEAWVQAGRRIIPEVPFVTEIEDGATWGCKA